MAVEDLYGVAWSGSRYVAVGSSRTVITSVDGVSWTNLRSGGEAATESVTYCPGPGVWVEVGDGGSIGVSADGINWNLHTPPTANDLLAVNWGFSFTDMGLSFMVIAVGDNGTILTSGDPFEDSWTTQSSGTTNRLSDVCHTWSATPGVDRDLHPPPGYFVVVGDDPIILTSPDAVNWLPRYTANFAPPPVFTVGLKSVFPAFTAVGSVPASSIPPPNPLDAIIITSSDEGVTWTEQTSGVTSTLNCIYAMPSMVGPSFEFVAVGDNGTILTSPDAVTWTEQRSGTSETLWRVAGALGSLVAVGDNGTILTSPDALTWTQQSFPP